MSTKELSYECYLESALLGIVPSFDPTMGLSMKSKTDPSLAIAYLRVSTDEQTLGMEAQRNAVTGWAERNGVTIAAWCEDLGVSGGSELEDRPGLLEALHLVRALKAGCLIAHKADRIARSVYVAECVRRDLVRAGSGLALVEGVTGEEPMQKLMATLADGFAEYERKVIGARTKAALAVKRSKGEKTGGSAPYGFRKAADGFHLEPCPIEYPAFQRVLELRRAGMGAVKIARVLEAEGWKPRGKRWEPASIHRFATAALERAS